MTNAKQIAEALLAQEQLDIKLNVSMSIIPVVYDGPDILTVLTNAITPHLLDAEKLETIEYRCPVGRAGAVHKQMLEIVKIDPDKITIVEYAPPPKIDDKKLARYLVGHSAMDILPNVDGNLVDILTAAIKKFRESEGERR